MFVDIDIIGTTSKSEDLIIKQAVNDSIVSIFPNTKDVIFIDVEIVNDKDIGGDAFAAVLPLEEDTFIISLSEEALQDDVTLYKTICHECVHIKQYIQKELIHVNQFKAIFKNKEYEYSVTPYRELPWEKEAFEKEEEIFECFAHNLK